MVGEKTAKEAILDIWNIEIRPVDDKGLYRLKYTLGIRNVDEEKKKIIKHRISEELGAIKEINSAGDDERLSISTSEDEVHFYIHIDFISHKEPILAGITLHFLEALGPAILRKLGTLRPSAYSEPWGG